MSYRDAMLLFLASLACAFLAYTDLRIDEQDQAARVSDYCAMHRHSDSYCFGRKL